MNTLHQKARVWFEIHKWTSLVCTLFLLLLCLTGLPLIFHEEIEKLTSDVAQFNIDSDVPKMSLDDLVEKAQNAHPDHVTRFVLWRDEQPGAVTVMMADSIDAPPENALMVMMNEQTGEILNQPKFNEGFMYIMLKLHMDLFGGMPGKFLVGFMGLLFVLAIVSGILLYSPIMKKYNFGMIRTEKSSRIKWLDLHNLLGVSTLAWALVIGVTGVINTTAEMVLGIWQRGELAEMVAPYAGAQPLSGAYSSLQEAVARTQQEAPDMKPSIIAFPGTVFTSEHHYAVFMKGHTPITSRLIKPALIDAKTGELTDLRGMPWYINMVFISQPLHFGDYGGLPLKILWAIFDIITIIILLSGLCLWFRRLKSNRDRDVKKKPQPYIPAT